MSYRVLARTYRSKTFEEIVGQEALATTLKNAIESDRVHHGYLFTGTRGVGKTSMARILAKALNCLSASAPTVTPCGVCELCRAVAEGEDVDVVEIDAASNTGVDDIRELRSNAAFRPARARFKVYIIDEVHMLSTNAFNALLKTLEEPPSHVKFILATTDPQKVPATIHSRCQRFDFRAIDVSDIAAHLRRIVEAEGIKADEVVLRRVARLANGSMRDALSLLDKLLSYEAKHLTAEIGDQVIPPAHDELAAALMDAVGQEDAAGALETLDRALQSGRTIERFCDNLIEHVRTLMIVRICGEGTDLVDIAAQERPAIIAQSEKFDAPTYVYMITLIEELKRSVKFSGAARALADAAVVRLAMSRSFSDIKTLIDRLDAGDESVDEPGGEASGKKKEFAGRADTAVGPPIVEKAESRSVVEPGGGRKPVVDKVPAARAAPRERSASVGSDVWSAVAADPLVERVRAAVDGTLFDIRPAREESSSDEVLNGENGET